MEEKNLGQVKELINKIADSYDLPTDEQVKEMQRLKCMENFQCPLHIREEEDETCQNH